MYVSRTIVYLAILIISIALSYRIIKPVVKSYVPIVINVLFGDISTEIYPALTKAGITMSESQKRVFEDELKHNHNALGFKRKE
ncbi:MAG: hypothetical protein K0Q53_61 [Massilibacillus sp.]|jgi:ABC-type proline/glycine betaine transport system permease subunit|nr:hypothetical protein [Massilibacillus sp.]